MANLKDFFNKIKNSNRIFTREEIKEMSTDEFRSNEKAIDYQLKEIGVPTSADLSLSDDVVFVHAYTRDDGTNVKAHYRSKYGRSAPGITGAASNLEKADFSEYAETNPLIKINMLMNAGYPDTQEMANIYLTKPENAPLSKEYTYIQPGFAENLNKTYNLTGNKKIDKKLPGILYNAESTISKNASNSIEMQNAIRKQYNVKTGKFNSDKIEINFTKDTNLHLSIGHGTILQPTIDKDGYFNGILYDKYDFSPLYRDYYSSPKITIANNIFLGYGAVNLGQSYYLFTPIRFKW